MMFKKVLIVDDHDDVNKSVLDVLQSLDIGNIQKAQYCDDAFLKIKKAEFDKEPFDLIISDLSFKGDHRECKFCSGEDLIDALRKDYKDLPIIVYSMKDQLQKVRLLINNFNVNAYVCKDRNGTAELEKAITAINNKEQFLSPQVQQALSPKTNLEIDDYDLELLKQLSFGYSKEQISLLFKEKLIRPSSLSSVEKRQNKLLIQFKANNATHLISIVKDLGLI
ncbi:response regulator [Psychroserpens sp. Hel_I_66]|uniref:response regulator n=1 Tax=Psychroserpens sp. Hel_I_66 TaxID=1250004 RepID=UPI000B1B4CA6|nr:response regulator [Psychroserpens sp. Hel_I_66]